MFLQVGKGPVRVLKSGKLPTPGSGVGSFSML